LIILLKVKHYTIGKKMENTEGSHSTEKALPDNDCTADQSSSSQSAASQIETLRFMSIDDLLILTLLNKPSMSVTAAANTLCLTQPAVTQRLRKMEDIFGEKITKKRGRSIELTTFGKQIAQRAQRALGVLQGSTETTALPTTRLPSGKSEMTSQP
jgi:DNA-binding MarR family transcriptional regulator